MPDNKSMLSGIGVMAALTISSKLVRLAILMVTARFLTPEDFGVVAAFTMVYSLAYLVAEMGIVRTIIQRPIISKKHIGSALNLSLIICITLCLSLVVFSGNIANFLTIDGTELPLKISGLMFLILGVSNVCSALMQRNGEAISIGKVQAIGTVVGNIFVTVPLLYYDFGFWSIIIGMWITELISVIFILLRGWNLLYFRAYKKELKEILKYGVAFFFNNTLTLLSQQIDIALISKSLGGAMLGSYSRAMQLVEFPNQIYLLIVDRVIFPIMSSLKDDKDKLTKLFLQSISLLSLALCVGTLTIILGADEIVLFMMGDQWGQVASLLKILAICIVFRALTSFMDSYLAAYNLVKLLTIKQMISLLFMAVFLFFGVQYGIKGVAYAVVTSSMFRFSLTLLVIMIKTNANTKSMLSTFVPSILSLIIILLFYWFLSYVLSLDGLFNTLVVLMFFAVFCVIKPISSLVTQPGKEFLLKKFKSAI
ncbi:polysaccharide transporter, PST family [Pseudoalteromonas sp. BSi20652]|uniref:oligosaccharide flippase family protein n=1 Tax=Pseudoalteromonas sp. BSi20652 TaxID=388384 RepID=UPI0002318BEC|nr:oligosaccharide flippase family protein [Pseudoalteromonas sp. BSi20652]GAA61186.1 polysaccharide transporter, PST family [Pseudoalteromonas sp. BSi20652]